MRLNESSMNKLFDLITMGLKYQVLIKIHKMSRVDKHM